MTLEQAFGLFRWQPAEGAGGALNQREYVVDVSQTIKYGDVVLLSTNKVQEALALPGSNNSATISGGNLASLGIALADITTNSAGVEAVTGRMAIPVGIWDANLDVILGVYNGTPANAIPSNVAFGTRYNLARVRGASASSWGYMLAYGSTTNGELVVQQTSGQTAASEIYGLVIARYLASTAATDAVRQV
jgi:hypothetical protein